MSVNIVFCCAIYIDELKWDEEEHFQPWVNILLCLKSEAGILLVDILYVCSPSDLIVEYSKSFII